MNDKHNMVLQEKIFHFTGIFWVLISFWEGEKCRKKHRISYFFILLFFRVTLPLKDFDHTQRPTTRSLFILMPNTNSSGKEHQPRWYPLQCKPSQNKPGYRGELEVSFNCLPPLIRTQNHSRVTISSNRPK